MSQPNYIVTRLAQVRFWRGIIGGRRRAYRDLFDAESRSASHVLSDLARFCRATKTTAGDNSHASAQLEGRRQVWLRINYYLHLAEKDLDQLAQQAAKDEGRET